MREGITRKSNRVELNKDEAQLVLRALQAQADKTAAQTDWPDLIPYSREDCLKSHADIMGRIQNLACFSVKEKVKRASKKVIEAVDTVAEGVPQDEIAEQA